MLFFWLCCLTYLKIRGDRLRLVGRESEHTSVLSGIFYLPGQPEHQLEVEGWFSSLCTWW